MNSNQKSNLHSFLQSVTPIVSSKFQSKDTSEYFTLGDIWDCYEEWSSYGVGVPITLKDNIHVVQYFAPQLSAIQIYTINSPTTLRELSSDDGNDNSSMEVSKNQFGYLYLEYSEVVAPAWRLPMVDKVSMLSKKHPGIEKLKSTDLSPANWMAVAWCPIYYVPMIGLRKKVPTYFLTYHTISSIFQENLDDETEDDIALIRKEDGRIPLSPFGLASYKMQEDVWINKVQAHTKYADFHSAAASWLKQLNFSHYDFSIYTSKPGNMDHIYLF